MSPNQLRGLLVAGLQPSIASVYHPLWRHSDVTPFPLWIPALHSADLPAKLMEVAGTSGPTFCHVARPGNLPVGWLWRS